MKVELKVRADGALTPIYASDAELEPTFGWEVRRTRGGGQKGRDTCGLPVGC